MNLKALILNGKKTTDPNGKLIDYYLFYCEDEQMENCVIEKVGHEDLELVGKKDINYLFLAGTILPFFLIKRKKHLLITMILFSTFFISCDDGKALFSKLLPNISATDTEISLTATDLKTNTNYFWKVIATNETGEKTESESWNFIVK